MKYCYPQETSLLLSIYLCLGLPLVVVTTVGLTLTSYHRYVCAQVGGKVYLVKIYLILIVTFVGGSKQ